MLGLVAAYDRLIATLRPSPAGHATHGGREHAQHAGHEDHAAMFRSRFWLSLALTIPIVAYSEMVQAWLGYTAPAFPGSRWISPVLGTVVFLYGGWPFLSGGWDEAKRRQPGMMLLIALAITVAFAASAATTLGLFELEFWWEVATLITIMLLGHWLEMRAVGQARSALEALAELLPDEAERVAGDQIEVVPIDALAPGDVVLVRPGGRVPADGVIIDGAAELDESTVTGESRPVAKAVGDRVIAGTVVTDSAIRVRVEAVGGDTALAGIQRLVAEAQQSRSRAQVLADRAAALLFYAATAAGIATFFGWSALGQVEAAVTRTVTVLVIACPHALGLAIPLVTAISTSVSARHGILVTDRLALERMRRVDVVLFDKTGTLTKGQHVVTGVAAVDGEADRPLALAAAVEADSEHPLARAIVAAARERGPAPAATDFRSYPGRGVEATVEGQRVAVGGPALLRERGLSLPAELTGQVEAWQARGAAVLTVVVDGQVRGAIALEDEIRPESRDAVDALHRLGIKVVMITGDARQVAEAVAADLGIDEVFAEVLPEDKAEVVAKCCQPEVRSGTEGAAALASQGASSARSRRLRVRGATPRGEMQSRPNAAVLPGGGTRLQARGHVVAMVGDGVNDAPALARADVGIAIGAGTDVAIESAGVVLASDDPRQVVSLIRLSRASYRKMVQNLAWAAGYNLVAIPLAAGVLAWAGIVLPPAVGAVLMSASTIVVALNAQLLRRVDLHPL